MRDESWREQARCWVEDTELFFPTRDKDKYKTIADQAKTMCLGAKGKSPCPAVNQSQWYAKNSDQVHGIWGGMSQHERKPHGRQWRRPTNENMHPAANVPHGRHRR